MSHNGDSVMVKCVCPFSRSAARLRVARNNIIFQISHFSWNRDLTPDSDRSREKLQIAMVNVQNRLTGAHIRTSNGIVYFFLEFAVYKTPVAQHPHKLGNSAPCLTGFVSRARVICNKTSQQTSTFHQLCDCLWICSLLGKNRWWRQWRYKRASLRTHLE